MENKAKCRCWPKSLLRRQLFIAEMRERETCGGQAVPINCSADRQTADGYEQGTGEGYGDEGKQSIVIKSCKLVWLALQRVKAPIIVTEEGCAGLLMQRGKACRLEHRGPDHFVLIPKMTISCFLLQSELGDYQ